MLINHPPQLKGDLFNHLLIMSIVELTKTGQKLSLAYGYKANNALIHQKKAIFIWMI
jgi:hypothetical protein